MNRREMLATTGAATLGALCNAKADEADAPASRVAIVRCRDYAKYGQQLSQAFDQIGGIKKLVHGKTVALKLNLTGNPKNFPLTSELPYRTDPMSVAATVHLFAKAGARRVRMIESFFPADQDLSLRARYGLDVNAINNMGVPVVWENVQNLGNYKQYVRMKVPGGVRLSGVPIEPGVFRVRRLRLDGKAEEPLHQAACANSASAIVSVSDGSNAERITAEVY